MTVETQDIDTFHTMPISVSSMPIGIIPFENKALRNARLIKNSNLKTVVELFRNEASGSGQMSVEDAIKYVNEEAEATSQDLVILRKLSHLSSYDVYSLRISLREKDIPVNDFSALQLSDEKKQELSGYMHNFTQPLLQKIYGTDDLEVKEFDDLINLFRNPDVKTAREKLNDMAKMLSIDIMEIPKFLEDYGDIFLSLAYYKQNLDELAPITRGFLDSLNEIRNNWELKNDANLISTCKILETTFIGLNAQLKLLFDKFDASANSFWDDISAARFQKLKSEIESYHTTIGGVLCALHVKMTAWHELFPNQDTGGPVKRAEFIMLHLRQGIDEIRKILNHAKAMHQSNR